MKCPTVSAGNIGRLAVIAHEGQSYLAEVIDQVAGTTKPKRVRVKFDLYLQDKVLMPSQYVFKEWHD